MTAIVMDCAFYRLTFMRRLLLLVIDFDSFRSSRVSLSSIAFSDLLRPISFQDFRATNRLLVLASQKTVPRNLKTDPRPRPRIMKRL